MRIKMLNAVVLGALLTIGSAAVNTVAAQTSGTTGTQRSAAHVERRKEMREKLKAMTPEQRKVARKKAKHRLAHHRKHMTAAQKTFAAARRSEVKSERSAVKAGTMTKEAAAQQRAAWRAAHPRPTKSGS